MANYDLEEWKTQENQRINSVTQEEFDKMKNKEQKCCKIMENIEEEEFGPMEGPAEKLVFYLEKN
jgi:hypothetical protein